MANASIANGKPPTPPTPPPPPPPALPKLLDSEWCAAAARLWPETRAHHVVGPEVIAMNSLSQTVVIAKSAIANRLAEAPAPLALIEE